MVRTKAGEVMGPTPDQGRVWRPWNQQRSQQQTANSKEPTAKSKEQRAGSTTHHAGTGAQETQRASMRKIHNAARSPTGFNPRPKRPSMMNSATSRRVGLARFPQVIYCLTR
jgi:hypothetical protein